MLAGVGNYDQVLRDSCVIEQYQAQYDPNTDFTIFGVGEHKTGDNQTMQEKVNQAEKPASESSDDEQPNKGSDGNTNLESGGHQQSTDGINIQPLAEDKEIYSDDEL